MSRPRILLLSGYDAASHRQWRECLVRHLPEFEWRTIALPDRHFYWRARGNPITFAFQHADELAAPVDLLIATSMVDLATLRGFVPALAQVPALLYFHENQFAYPTRKPSSNIVNAQLTSIYSALCATKILFNSNFNRQSFISGAAALLDKMPDGVPKGVSDRIESKADVLPVPIEPTSFGVQARSWDGPVEIVWNHRWEYDKQPQVFFDAMRHLKQAGLLFRLHVMGQSFRNVPECFAQARTELADHIDTWGHQPPDIYQKILHRAHVVVSTALHDFQGLSMLEAIQRGCVPVAPDRMAYPDYVPERWRYPASEGGQEAHALASTLETLLQPGRTPPVAPAIPEYLSTSLIDRYRQLIERLLLTS
jgi:glycosyltransferase involved in cell wall biosynthesis